MTPLCDRFGLLWERDALVLEDTLEQLSPLGKIKFLEIGIYQGQTGVGIQRWCSERCISLEWWGIDSGRDIDPKTLKWPWATIVKGNSDEVYPVIPNDFDAILIDGCHCRNHIILDTYNYSPKVVPGGFLLFHDTSPSAQGNDFQGHGPNTHEFHISALEAFKMIGWPHWGWTIFRDCYDKSIPSGGMRSYRRQA